MSEHVAPPRRIMKREPYEGPGTGRAWMRLYGLDEIPMTIMLTAAAPGEGAAQGDVFLSFTGAGDDEHGQIRYRLDIGAKRFLLSLLEQAVTIGDFERGV